MEAIGSEVGLKMRSAIKAKLMELGCYVDDELPDYVMVMVANKRTRSQMEEDLQLFLSNNTEAFVNWLHQVLQKLQEVTISTKLVNSLDHGKMKAKQDVLNPKKSHKDKDKKKNKDKSKSKDKTKAKSKKSKKEKLKMSPVVDTKESERITSNIPHLLMNLEKETAPSITDVFAGQILKSHRITPITPEQNDLNDDVATKKLSRNRFPIIDPASVSQIDSDSVNKNRTDSFDIPSITEIDVLKVENEKCGPSVEKSFVETKKRTGDSAGSGSDGEEFINIRSEAEELMDIGINDDASNNCFNRIDCRTPPLETSSKISIDDSNKSRTREPVKAPESSVVEFSQIELNLPKRPLRDRLGVKSDVTGNKKAINLVNPYRLNKSDDSTRFEKNGDSSDRLSSKVHYERCDLKSNSNDLRNKIPVKQRLSLKENTSHKKYETKRRIGSRVVPLPNEPIKENVTVAVASVVRAPPRPQQQGMSAGSQLLFRAVADAHKSLLNMPPKVNIEPIVKKKALVLPMRRNINPQKIIIEVPTNNIPTSKLIENQDSNSDFEIDMDAESLDELENDRDNRLTNVDQSGEYVPEPLGNRTIRSKPLDYIPTKKKSTGELDDIPSISKILNPSNDSPKRNSEKDPQFVVTLDGFDPNFFLEKKISRFCSENEGDDSLLNHTENKVEKTVTNKRGYSFEKNLQKENIIICFKDQFTSDNNTKSTSTETEVTPVIENVEPDPKTDTIMKTSVQILKENENEPQKKRKGSPIIFNKTETKISKTVIKNDGSKEDKTNVSNKYDSVPSLPDLKKSATSSKELKCKYFPDCRLGTGCEFYHPPMTVVRQNSICRSFPACAFGNKCVYVHPLCKFNTTCVRADCPYSHSEKRTSIAAIGASPTIASRVVPVVNYKGVNATSLPSICKFYPNCLNPLCHWYHPKPCRYGKHCMNKLECNFYHYDLPTSK